MADEFIDLVDNRSELDHSLPLADDVPAIGLGAKPAPAPALRALQTPSTSPALPPPSGCAESGRCRIRLPSARGARW